MGFPGGDNFDLYFEGRVRVEADKARRVLQMRELA